MDQFYLPEEFARAEKLLNEDLAVILLMKTLGDTRSDHKGGLYIFLLTDDFRFGMEIGNRHRSIRLVQLCKVLEKGWIFPDHVINGTNVLYY